MSHMVDPVEEEVPEFDVFRDYFFSGEFIRDSFWNPIPRSYFEGYVLGQIEVSVITSVLVWKFDFDIDEIKNFADYLGNLRRTESGERKK